MLVKHLITTTKKLPYMPKAARLIMGNPMKYLMPKSEHPQVIKVLMMQPMTMAPIARPGLRPAAMAVEPVFQ